MLKTTSTLAIEKHIPAMNLIQITRDPISSIVYNATKNATNPDQILKPGNAALEWVEDEDALGDLNIGIKRSWSGVGAGNSKTCVLSVSIPVCLLLMYIV